MKNFIYQHCIRWGTGGRRALLCYLLLLAPLFAAAQQNQAGTGTPGLLATYYRGYFYDDQSFFDHTTPCITDRTIGNLNFPVAMTDNFNVGRNATYYQPGNPDEFSAQFKGRIYVATAGLYTFYLGSDDAAYLYLDTSDKFLASNTGDKHMFRETTVSTTLTPGFHTLHINYGEHGGSQGLILSYAGPNMPRQIIPNGVFYTEVQAPIQPVLTLFDATARDEEVDLNWTTTTERNSQSFVVERSTDGGKTFQDLVELAGAGTSAAPHAYQTVDTNPIVGVNYYRLRQMRTDHEAVYSPVKQVTVQKTPYSLSVFPMPNNGTFFLRIEPAIHQVAKMELVDISGRPVYWSNLEMNGLQEQRISPNLPVGMYIMHLTTTHGKLTQKVILGR